MRWLAVDCVVEKVEKSLGRSGGDRRAKPVEAALGGGEGGTVAQKMGACAEQGLQLGVELGRGDARLAQSAHEQRQVADVGLGEALARLLAAQGGQKSRHVGVDLVVGAAAVAREFKDAHVAGLDVVDNRAQILGDGYDDVAAGASRPGHECAHQAGEVAFDNLHGVALLKVDSVERIERQSVGVGACYGLERLHGAIVDGGVALGSAVV